MTRPENGAYKAGPFIYTSKGSLGFEDFIDEVLMSSFEGGNEPEVFNAVKSLLKGALPKASTPMAMPNTKGGNAITWRPGLDEYDNVRYDDVEYQAYYGIWKRD